ncbi:MAG TPA: fibronectin type III domain-containing protein, partial [Solirubrobacteraceae bacterium]|nr:fibronectin type III domain-containing protein [Solirubrobacteraceae bacterium]
MSIGARKPVLPVIAVCCVLVGWLVWSAVPALAVGPETPEVSVEALVPPTIAVVHGVLNPGVEGAPGTYELGTYEFLYKQGKAGCVGEGKAPVSPGISLGGGKEAVSETLQGLSPDTEYSVCLLVRDGIKGEQAVSTPATFTTSPLPEIPVTRGPVGAVTATTATFEGELNPGGATGRLSYQLDYNTNGSCTGGKSTAPVEVTEAMRFQLPPVEIAELEPNETYTFCLVATNAFGEQAQGNEVSVLTGQQAPTITGASVANITSTSATVNAEVYPHGEVTTYRVEYGPTNTYGSSTPEMSTSAQHGPASIEAQLTGLVPNSEYHYRVVATNDSGSEWSLDATFTTGESVVAGSQGLPDNRTYEMVTPPENGNADVYVPEALPRTYSENVEGIPTRRMFQVSADGSAVAYEGEPTSGGGNGEEGNGLGNQFLAKRLASGWVTRSIQPAGIHVTYYQGFSSDLSAGIITSGTPAEPEISLSAEALGEGYRVLYERATNGDVYRPLFTNDVHPNRSAEKGKNHFEAKGVVGGTGGEAPVFAGGSSDYSDLLFEANDALLAGNGTLETELENDVKQEIAEGEEHDENYLYDSVDSKLSLVDVSPEGRVVPGATVGGPPLNKPESNDPNFRGAISADGKRVYWSSIESIRGGEFHYLERERPTGLYLRDNPGEPQSPIANGKCSVLSDACTVVVSNGEARYWASAADGRYAFYTEGGELYRFDAEPEADQVSREVLAGGGAGVVGVLGVSEDGEHVYFAAKGALAPGATAQTCEADAGCNLYLLDKGQTRFVARLSGGDGDEVPLGSGGQPVESGDWIGGLAKTRSFVTSDGESLVFMSSESLSVTGYPDGYRNNGAEEVYVYEAGSNSLFCASCGSTREGA